MHPTVRSFYNLEEVWGGKDGEMKAAVPAGTTLKQKPKKKPRACQGYASSRVRR